MNGMRFFWRAPMLLMAVGIAVAQAQSTGLDPNSTLTQQGGHLLGAASADQDKMPRITNDTREYCDELRHAIARIRVRRGELPPEPALLAREGERMCQMGHFRPGIYRLRSALMMLRP